MRRHELFLVAAALGCAASGCASGDESDGLQTPESCTVGPDTPGGGPEVRVILTLAAHGGVEVVATDVNVGYGLWPAHMPGGQALLYRFLDANGTEVAAWWAHDFRYDVQLGPSVDSGEEEESGGGCTFNPEATGTDIFELKPGSRVLEIVEDDSLEFFDCGDYVPSARVLARIDLAPCTEKFCEAAGSEESCR
jgi:hypothetical protein